MVNGMGDGIAATVKVMRWLAITMFCAFGGACTTTFTPDMTSLKAHSPATLHRVYVKMPDASGKRTSQRAGHYTVGKPYVVKGKRYYPKEEPGYDRSGIASWYARGFQGRRTANGETYDPGRLSAAHPTLPLPSYVRVTNLTNGSSVVVRVNDRGPFHKGRLIDISSKAAEMLDMTRRGTAYVRVQYVGRAALNGDDMAFLMASQRKRQGPLGVNRPIGAQVAGKPLTSYGERSTLFVGSKSAGNFLAASRLGGTGGCVCALGFPGTPLGTPRQGKYCKGNRDFCRMLFEQGAGGREICVAGVSPGSFRSQKPPDWNDWPTIASKATTGRPGNRPYPVV
ncbi:septal ring lytic transglycosylase RlpA family protein [Ensifer adhaerens]|uniref:septal ring lytic transglycosylase RlpA family protein n=1 Tax=Ensifer adhaerens TaxID=106592 RepID=UPI0023F98204|nr:septal ring lytic transglycosylase RlpA family protein [Ensifer adhaerens]MDF8356606.1 septal ring lytic transglycosylase RlpA family protein [Ensifer adhaerens]